MEPDDADEWEADASDEWGPQMAIPGYLVEPGQEQYRHRIGGDTWKAVEPRAADLPPVVLLILDLSDPRLAIWSGGLGVFNLIPFRTRRYPSDGAQLLEIVKRSRRIGRR